MSEGRYLDSLSPSGFDILDERSGLGTARADQPFRSYLFDGANDAIEWTTADIGTLYASWYDVTNKVWDSGTITHGSGKYSFSPGGNVAISNLKIWTDDQSTTEQDQAFELSSIPVNLWFWGKCDDIHDTVAYDSNGGANNGTKTNITTGTGPGTFHAEGGTGWLPDSWQNRVGYSDSANGPVPRDESDTDNDVLTDPLDNVGPAPRNARLINSNCVEFDGVDDYISVPVTMLSSQAWELSAKLYVDSGATGDCTFIGSSSNDSMAFRYRTSTNTWFVAYGGFAEGTNSWQVLGSAMTDDEFHDVVIGWDGVDTLSMSIDGVSMGTKVLTAPAASVPLKIGNRWVTAAFWDGRMCDVRFTQNSDLLLHLPLSEGEGTDHYNRAGGNHAQAMNTGGGYRVTDQNARPSNFLDGYSLYEHATLDPIRVPYGSDGNPLSITPPSGYTKTSDHPAGAFHNGAETQFNFKPEPDAPWVRQWESATGELLPTAYSYGDLLPANMSKVVDGLTERLFIIHTPGEITPSPATAVATVVNPSVALGPAPVSPAPSIAICTTVSPVVVESILNTVAPAKVVADLRSVTVVGR